MADWDRDRDDRYGRGRSDRGYGYGGGNYGYGSNWGRDDDDRYSGGDAPMSTRDRNEYAGSRGQGFLGGDYARSRYDRGDDDRSEYGGGRYGTLSQDDRGTWSNLERGRDRDRDVSGYGSYGSDTFGMTHDAEQRPSYRGRGPKGFHRTDDRLRELVSERLSDHHDIDASEIEVTVSNSEVTLTGTVDDRRTKRLAEDIAESVSGVNDVHNQLKVDRGFFSRMADTVRDAVQKNE